MSERKNDILKICQSAGYTEGLIYGGFVNGKHFVSYGAEGDGAELACVGAPIILVVENGGCRTATDKEWVYFYENFVKD